MTKGRTIAIIALIAALASCRGPSRPVPSPSESRRDGSAAADAATRARSTGIGDASAIAPRAADVTSWTETLPLGSAPFSTHPDVFVRGPNSLRAVRTFGVVVFLHGWFGCVSVVVGRENAPCTPGGPLRFAMDVAAQFDRAGIAAILVVPQLAFDAASSAGGRLSTDGGLRRMLGEIVSSPAVRAHLRADVTLDAVQRVALVAHSGAFVPAAEILAHGGVDVHELHLLDALYRARPEFSDWVRTHRADFDPRLPDARRLTIIYTDREGTGPRSRAFIGQTASALPMGAPRGSVVDHPLLAPPAEAIWSAPVFAMRTAVAHEDIPRTFLATLLDSRAWRR